MTRFLKKERPGNARDSLGCKVSRCLVRTQPKRKTSMDFLEDVLTGFLDFAGTVNVSWRYDLMFQLWMFIGHWLSIFVDFSGFTRDSARFFFPFRLKGSHAQRTLGMPAVKALITRSPKYVSVKRPGRKVYPGFINPTGQFIWEFKRTYSKVMYLPAGTKSPRDAIQVKSCTSTLWFAIWNVLLPANIIIPNRVVICTSGWAFKLLIQTWC